MSVGGAENIRKRQSTDGKYNREEAQSASSGVNVLVSIQKQLLTKGVRRKCPGGSLSQILSSSIIGSEVAESISKMALVLFHYRLESTHIQNVWELVWKFKSASCGLWKDKTSQAFKRVIVN